MIWRRDRPTLWSPSDARFPNIPDRPERSTVGFSQRSTANPTVTKKGRTEMHPATQRQLDGRGEAISSQGTRGHAIRLVVSAAVLMPAVFSQVLQAQALTVTTAAVTFPAVTLDGPPQPVSG